jgi:hypothetical protein
MKIVKICVKQLRFTWEVQQKHTPLVSSIFLYSYSFILITLYIERKKERTGFPGAKFA